MSDPRVIISAEDRTQRAFSSVRQSLRGMESAAMTARRALGTLGAGVSIAAITTGLIRAGRAAIQYGDDMQKAAAKTGIAASTFSELAAAAKMSDVDVSSLATALKKMQVAVSQAGSGMKAPLGAFKALGIEIATFRRLAPERQFELIADRISRLKDPADRTRAAVELFGRAGADLLPMFEEGAAGIRKAREEVQRLGGTLTDEQIKKLSEADDAVKRLSQSWAGFARTLTAAVAPALSEVMDQLAGAPTAISDEARKQQLRGQLSTWGAQHGAIPKAELEAMRLELAQIEERERRRLLGPGRQVSVGGGGLGTAPGFTPEGDKDKGDGLSQINVWQRQVFNLRNAQQEALADLNAETVRDTQAAMTAIGNTSFETLRDIGEWWRQAHEEAKKSLSASAAFAEEMGADMRRSLAEFLFDPFKDGLDGMLQGFVDMLRQMVAQIAAQQLLTSFFTWGSNLGGGVGGFFGSLLKGITGKAAGGPVMAGTPYLVGERGPELFVPRQSGSIVPNGAGGVVFNQTIHLDARGADADRIIAMLPAWGRTIRAAAVADVQDKLHRGKLA